MFRYKKIFLGFFFALNHLQRNVKKFHQNQSKKINVRGAPFPETPGSWGGLILNTPCRVFENCLEGICSIIVLYLGLEVLAMVLPK